MSQKLTPELLDVAERYLMRSMNDDPGHAIEVSTEELVSIKMDARFQVTQVTIRSARLEPHELAALEQAILSSVNNAFQQVVLQIGDGLTKKFHDLGAFP